MSIDGRLVSSFVDKKTITCVSTHHRPKGSKDAFVLGLSDIDQKEVDSAALGSQKAHRYTKEELRKMKKDFLVAIAKELYLNTVDQRWTL